MRSLLRYCCLLIVLALLIPLPVSAQDGELLSLEMEHGGITRDYQLYVPPSYDPATPAPLLLVLHGGGMTGEAMYNVTADSFTTRGDADGWLLAYPSALGGDWTDHFLVKTKKANGQPVDDVDFLVALIDHIHATRPVDLDHVFVAGISNGGSMTFALACNRADRFAGATVLTMGLPVDLPCDPARPLPIMLINGTADPIVPFDGGPINLMMVATNHIVHSTADSVTFWREVNGCSANAETTELDERRDGTSVTGDVYADCASGAPVVLITVHDGGHAWPGVQVGLLQEMLSGRVSREFKATDIIWDFFNWTSERLPASPG